MNTRRRWTTAAAVLLAGVLFTRTGRVVQAQPAWVVHYFNYGSGAGSPTSGLIVSADGTLYGLGVDPLTGVNKAFGVTPDNEYFWYGDIPGTGGTGASPTSSLAIGVNQGYRTLAWAKVARSPRQRIAPRDRCRRRETLQPFDGAVPAADDERRCRARIAHAFDRLAVGPFEPLLHGVEVFGEGPLERNVVRDRHAALPSVSLGCQEQLVHV